MINPDHEISLLPIERAKHEVALGNAQIEEALESLKDKVGEGARLAERVSETAKNPLAMVGILIVIGIFFGQVLRFSFQHQRRSR